MAYRLIGVLCLLSAAAPCSSQCSGGHRLEGASLLTGLETEFWDWRMRDAPLFSTAVGETRHNDDLESYDYSVYGQRKNTVEQFLHRLQRIDRDQLTKDQQLDYDIFLDYLQTFLAGAHWNSYFAVNSVNFLEGVHTDPGRMQAIMPFSTLPDYENYLQRLTKLPVQIDQKIGLLQRAVSTGSTMNNVSVMAVPGQIEGLLQKSVEDSQFYQPAFTSKLDALGIPADTKLSLRTRAREAVTNLTAALQRLKTYLVHTYLPAARSTWGMEGLGGGREAYRRCLRYHTSTSMTPQEVHDLGLKEVARIRGNMEAALKRLQFSGTIKQFYDGVRTDAQFHANSSEALMNTYKDYIFNRIFPKLHTIFKDIPDLPLEVQPMPYDGPGGVYLSGTPDGSVPGIFYANIMRPQETVTIGIMALVLHETVPGHHLQAIYSLTSNLPKYRAFYEDDNYYRMPATFPINTAYLEGWALYSEYLGEELGLYTDDYLLMGRYSEEVFRACRLVVDTGLHYFGWDRERAIQYLLDNTASPRAEMATEVDRYLTWPGQATAYKIGEIKIKQLRQRATDDLGSLFHLPDFHNVLLKNGGMPLSLLERLVDHWIAEVKANGRPDGAIG
ncbi:uncharacterized protein LOC143282006 [Babylonia areolata]|uniref:uncharacterized protein LOC143282006 n=1 Tax=Babylonia areolata TaxID=304850 RepID=UPI003FD3B084